MMTDPRRYLVRMLMFLAVVVAIAALLHAPLLQAFMGNPALNGVIVGALFIGIAFTFRQILRLMPERRWLTTIQKTGKLDNRQVKPVLLATVYAMLADQRQEARLSALSLRSVLDGVAARGQPAPRPSGALDAIAPRLQYARRHGQDQAQSTEARQAQARARRLAGFEGPAS